MKERKGKAFTMATENWLDDPKHSLKYLTEIEEMGEEIIVDRQDIISLDKRRCQNREAKRSIPKNNKKIWLTIGSTLFKVPATKAKEIIERDEVKLDVEINTMRSNLKVKVNKLRDLEHKGPVPGLMLNPLSKSEMSAINQVFGVK